MTGRPDPAQRLAAQRARLDRADEQQLKDSAGVWVDPPFCADELAAAPKESVTHLGDGEIVHD